MSVTRSSPVVTKWVTIMSALMGQSPVETEIDVHTDINDAMMHFVKITKMCSLQ